MIASRRCKTQLTDLGIHLTFRGSRYQALEDGKDVGEAYPGTTQWFAIYKGTEGRGGSPYEATLDAQRRYEQKLFDLL